MPDTAAQTPLPAALPLEELARHVPSLKEITLLPGALLCREGEPGDRFYIICEGQLDIIKAYGSAEERLLSMADAGEFVGEMSLLNPDGLRTATVRARSAAQVLELARSDFDTLLQRHPALVYNIMHVLSLHLRATNNTLIADLRDKNHQLTEALRQLTGAYEELQIAHVQIIEKEKLEHELQVARQIQLSILPQTLPHLAGFNFGALSVPARAVGGDFFDFITLDDEHLGIVVGDVSDQGMPAAIFMALTRSLLRAEAGRGAAPREVLLNVNRLLLDMSDAGMFVTVLYGVLHRATRQFAYARAGHELPLLVDRQGTCLPVLRSLGQPLGIDLQPELDEQTITLPPGSTLLVYSDGVTDAVDLQDVSFGLARLQGVMCNYYRTPAQALCDRVLQQVQAHASTAPQFDDVTVVAVQPL